LKDAGMKKINFAGGEPFLYPKFLGQLVQYCKEDLKLESVSIVSNGSTITEGWMQQYGSYLDILAISCDSFVEDTNVKIGRGNGAHINNVFKCRDLCEKYGIKFKLNTVVNAYNWHEDMNEWISKLNPCRWKVFQVLILKGENSGTGNDKRDGREFIITDQQFQQFVDRHRSQAALVPESNSKMKDSYLILDEKMRFLNCTGNKKEPSESILDVGVDRALKQSGFDSKMFQNRGGVYDWTNKRDTPCSSKEFDW
jgi:radical S-adenosyl methionine domain-containing protein 2